MGVEGVDIEVMEDKDFEDVEDEEENIAPEPVLLEGEEDSEEEEFDFFADALL